MSKRKISPTLISSEPSGTKIKSSKKQHNSYADWANAMASRLQSKYRNVKDRTYMDMKSSKLKLSKKKKSTNKKKPSTSQAYWASKGGVPTSRCSSGKKWIKGYTVAGYCRKQKKQ
jgi:hypothetical protein